MCGIHCHMPSSTRFSTSVSTQAAMVFQMRASILPCAVTAIVPAAADVIMERQSVLILGRVGNIRLVIWIAHSSAAAAVSTLEGGAPKPYPNSSPDGATTTNPKPIVLMSRDLPQIELPSVYQVAS